MPWQQSWPHRAEHLPVAFLLLLQKDLISAQVVVLLFVGDVQFLESYGQVLFVGSQLVDVVCSTHFEHVVHRLVFD